MKSLRTSAQGSTKFLTSHPWCKYFCFRRLPRKSRYTYTNYVTDTSFEILTWLKSCTTVSNAISIWFQRQFLFQDSALNWWSNDPSHLCPGWQFDTEFSLDLFVCFCFLPGFWCRYFQWRDWEVPFFRNTGTNYGRYLEVPGIVSTNAVAATHVSYTECSITALQ